MSKGQKRDCKC